MSRNYGDSALNTKTDAADSWAGRPSAQATVGNKCTVTVIPNVRNGWKSDVDLSLGKSHRRGMDPVQELKNRYTASPKGLQLDQTDIERWCREAGVTRDELYDALAETLAIGFHEGTFDFDFCDSVVNGLFGLYPDSIGLFWNVFGAFDAGEFHRDPLKRDDPPEEITRPAIAEIVRELRRR